ncbi:MAG: DUF5677 domain-containing protein [Methanosarcinales archaeon]|jgi:hypothetical protein|nr:DUF5677 domain-containing protein [Methanosarcinales archaeon]
MATDFRFPVFYDLDDYNTRLLLRLQEKAIKIYYECIILLLGGSASGAMARWRTLFEMHVFLKFLIKNPIVSEDLFMFKKTKNVGIYDWARKVFPKGRIDFYHFMKNVELNTDKDFRDMANKYNHADPTYLISDIDSYEDNDFTKPKSLFSPHGFMEISIMIILEMGLINMTFVNEINKRFELPITKEYVNSISIYSEKLLEKWENLDENQSNLEAFTESKF